MSQDMRLAGPVANQADFSSAQPALPNIGQAFAASGPYASFVLVATVPAQLGRHAVEIQNNSTGTIAIIRDDGTAGKNQVPMDASVIALGPAASAGAQGPSYYSQTCSGRYQVYAVNTSAQVAVFSD